MADVLDIRARLQAGKAGRGDVEFMLCGDHPDTGMLPVVMHDATGPFICALMCPECDGFIPIINGRPPP